MGNPHRVSFRENLIPPWGIPQDEKEALHDRGSAVRRDSGGRSKALAAGEGEPFRRAAYPGVMNAREILTDLAHRPGDAASELRPVLTATLLNAHPHHNNSIAWLLWHTGREIDIQIAELSGAEQVWTALGFDERFGLDLAPTDIGYGHTPEQARAIIVDDPDLLIAYIYATISTQVLYLATLTDDSLDAIIDENWTPPVTLGARLVSISADALAHVEQAAYIAGMGEAAFE